MVTDSYPIKRGSSQASCDDVQAAVVVRSPQSGELPKGLSVETRIPTLPDEKKDSPIGTAAVSGLDLGPLRPLPDGPRLPATPMTSLLTYLFASRR